MDTNELKTFNKWGFIYTIMGGTRAARKDRAKLNNRNENTNIYKTGFVNVCKRMLRQDASRRWFLSRMRVDVVASPARALGALKIYKRLSVEPLRRKGVERLGGSEI